VQAAIEPAKLRWYAIRQHMAAWFHLALLIVYLVEVARRHRDAEAWLASHGVSAPLLQWLVLGAPLLLYGLIYWSRHRKDTHDSAIGS